MSKKTAESSSDAPVKKSKNNLIPAVVLAAGLLGGGYFMSSSGGAKANAAPASPAAAGAATTPTTEKPVSGDVAKLDSITLNLADGRFVKLGLALQLKEGIEAASFANQAARSLDLAISTLGDRTYAQLAGPGGREAAKAELGEQVKAAYGGEVTGIYFTEFVMQ